jgi:hypothetical protein
LNLTIVDVLTGFLVWANECIVTVDASWHTRPDALTVVTVLNQAQASWKSIIHGLALALIKDSWPSTITTGHWLVVIVLGKTIGETVTDENSLKVDVALLVGENLGGEDRDVVASVRFSSNVEVLLGVLWELLEEQGEQCIHILAGGNGVADRATTVRVTNVDRLVKENDRGICVPGVWVVVKLEVLVDGGWTEL